jgi:hypothetical protein
MSLRSISKNALRYRPKLEALEDRRLLSIAANTATDGVFIRYNDGQLWERTSAGFRFIDTNTVSVSSGVDTSGNPSAFILYNNGALYEWSVKNGFTLIDVNAVSISGSQIQADTVFIVYDNGALFEHTGLSSGAGFSLIDVNATNVSAGRDSAGNPAAYIVYDNTALYEWSPSLGFHLIDVNVASVNADQLQANTAFIIYTNNYLYEHVGTSSASGFQFVDVNVDDVSVGTATGGATAAFILYTNGFVYEWSGPAGFRFIDSNAVTISATTQQTDTTFIVYDNTDLFEHVGTSSQSGFTFVDVNVEP